MISARFSGDQMRGCAHEVCYDGEIIIPFVQAIDGQMTPDHFRRLALSLPEVVESEHMGHPDFRVRGKVFATLAYPDEAWGMLKLTADQQKQFVRGEPKVFKPVKGGWGLKGATNVCLKPATKAKLFTAMVAAWRNRAPGDLADEFESGT